MRTLMGIKKARTKEMKVLTTAELGVKSFAGAGARPNLPSEKNKKSTQILTGSPKEAAAAAGLKN